MKLFSKRGQSTGEYAILFAIVLGAVFAVQGFVRHNIAGGLKAQADLFEASAEGNFVNVDTTADTAQRSKVTMQTSSNGVAQSKSNTFSISNTVQ